MLWMKLILSMYVTVEGSIFSWTSHRTTACYGYSCSFITLGSYWITGRELQPQTPCASDMACCSMSQ